MALWGSKLRKTDFDVIKRSRDVTNWERVRGYKKKIDRVHPTEQSQKIWCRGSGWSGSKC